VGSKSEIYHIIRQLCDAGKGDKFIVFPLILPENPIYLAIEILCFSAMATSLQSFLQMMPLKRK